MSRRIARRFDITAFGRYGLTRDTLNKSRLMKAQAVLRDF